MQPSGPFRLSIPGPGLVAGALALLLAACGTSGGRHGPPAEPPGPIVDQQKVGRPYQVAGVWYYPQQDRDYDETGIASWYGPNFHGQTTASGEAFDMNALTAAHPTLPLPSRVRVTNLENGRSLMLRVNDRGPFARDRIIDVSRRAAQLLGFAGDGTARVRVQLVREDGTVASRSEAQSEPKRVSDEDAVAGPLYVQVGSFSRRGNAREVKRRLSDLDAGIQRAKAYGETVYRVRIGPFEEESAAGQMLDRVFERGFHNARIFTERVG